MTFVKESNKITIIALNPGSVNHRASKIATDIFDDSIRVVFIEFGIDVVTVFVFSVAGGR